MPDVPERGRKFVMKCQICGKENASIHISEIKDGKKRSYYICQECAAKQGGPADIMGLAQIVCKLTSSLSKLQPPPKKEKEKSGKKDPVPEILEIPELMEFFEGASSAVSGEIPQTGAEEMVEEKPLRCSFCGWGSQQLQKTGRLGCPECYKFFAEILKEELGKMHKGIQHTGKHPRGLAPELVKAMEKERKKQSFMRAKEEELTRLQSDIQSAVAHEDYERAAVLRDQIYALEKQLADFSDSDKKNASPSATRKKNTSNNSNGRKKGRGPSSPSSVS